MPLTHLALPGARTWLPQPQGTAATAAPGGNPPTPPRPRWGGKPRTTGPWVGRACRPNSWTGDRGCCGKHPPPAAQRGLCCALAEPPGSELATPSSPGGRREGGPAGSRNMAQSIPPGQEGRAWLSSRRKIPFRSHLMGYRPGACMTCGDNRVSEHSWGRLLPGPSIKGLGGSFLQQVCMELRGHRPQPPPATCPGASPRKGISRAHSSAPAPAGVGGGLSFRAR